MLLVQPMADIAPINAHGEDTLRRRQPFPIARVTFDKARSFLSQLGFHALRHLERVIAHRLDVQGAIKWQKVLEGIEAHPIGHQRGPLRFHIEELRGNRLGEQSCQRPK